MRRRVQCTTHRLLRVEKKNKALSYAQCASLKVYKCIPLSHTTVPQPSHPSSQKGRAQFFPPCERVSVVRVCACDARIVRAGGVRAYLLCVYARVGRHTFPARSTLTVREPKRARQILNDDTPSGVDGKENTQDRMMHSHWRLLLLAAPVFICSSSTCITYRKREMKEEETKKPVDIAHLLTRNNTCTCNLRLAPGISPSPTSYHIETALKMLASGRQSDKVLYSVQYRTSLSFT